MPSMMFANAARQFSSKARQPVGKATQFALVGYLVGGFTLPFVPPAMNSLSNNGNREAHTQPNSGMNLYHCSR